MIRLALRSALSDRAAEGRVVVVDDWNFDVPRTKVALAALATLGVQGRSLVVAERDDENTWKSFANLPEVHVLSPGELNAYDVLVCDYIVFTRATLPSFSTPAAATPAPVEPAAVVDTDPSGEEEE
jgi:large subunit ribosomal protein L4|tara:strand:+ start:191 stop:568 length:378 start_codon:yes stop_codon:yes gene_type:complete